MTAELAVPDGTQRGVTGTVDLRHGELVVRVRPGGYRDAATRPIPPAPRADPTTLAGVCGMRYVGHCIGAEAASHYRLMAWGDRHPFLAWLRGWRW